MKTNQISIVVLEPDEGFTLTNGETYSKRVYLGIYDSPENWREIPDSEVPKEETKTSENENVRAG